MSQVLGSSAGMTSGRLEVWPALVIWEDAAHQPGWLEGEEVNASDCMVETVGWLMSETDAHLIMAQSITSGAHAQTIQIPLGMVHKIIILRD
jgi:hypothetical protein